MRLILAMVLLAIRVMEVFYIASLLRKKGKPLSTERVSHGRQCEAFALGVYQKLGFKLLHQNLRLKIAECDLVFEKNNRLLMVEVRGKKNPKYRPSLMLSRVKLNRLKLSAEILSVKYRKSVAVELFEVVGEFPKIEYRRFPIFFPSSRSDSF